MPSAWAPKTPSGVHHHQIIWTVCFARKSHLSLKCRFSSSLYEHVFRYYLAWATSTSTSVLSLVENPSGRMVPVSTVWRHLYFPHSDIFISWAKPPIVPVCPLPKHDLRHLRKLGCKIRLLDTCNPHRNCRGVPLFCAKPATGRATPLHRFRDLISGQSRKRSPDRPSRIIKGIGPLCPPPSEDGPSRSPTILGTPLRRHAHCRQPGS